MKRHALSTRLWHWLNAVSLIVLFMSGLNISNAHPNLYWGQWGFLPERAWANIVNFPGWATIPGYYDLAMARDYHVVFAWIFAVSLLLFMISALASRHFRRDIATRLREWTPASVWSDIRAHLRGEFEHPGVKYNFLQRATYGLVLFVLLPLMIFTGMTISPGVDAAWPFLLDVFGGRQSARSIHFIAAWGLCVFTVLHVVLVILHKPAKNLRDMITGGRDDAAS